MLTMGRKLVLSAGTFAGHSRPGPAMPKKMALSFVTELIRKSRTGYYRVDSLSERRRLRRALAAGAKRLFIEGS